MTRYPYDAGNMTMTIPLAKFADLHDKIKSRDDEIARLRAEVERLTEAGDAMAVALNLNDDVFDNHEKKLAQSAWLAAKEGKGQP